MLSGFGSPGKHIELLINAFYVTVEAGGVTKYKVTFSHNDIGLELHPVMEE